VKEGPGPPRGPGGVHPDGTMHRPGLPETICPAMAEGLSAPEVPNEVAEHAEHAAQQDTHQRTPAGS